MMDLSEVLTRISVEVSGIAQIGAAADVEQMLQAIRHYPACFLFAPVETAGENSTMNVVTQEVTQNFSIAVFVKSAGDISTAGIDAVAEANKLKNCIIAALLGWLPDGCEWVIEYDGSTMPYAKDGDQVWVYKFKTAYLISSR